MYSARSELTNQICSAIDFEQIGFVRTMKRGNKIYVDGTLGKPHEWELLRERVNQLGKFQGCELVYRGR